MLTLLKRLLFFLLTRILLFFRRILLFIILIFVAELNLSIVSLIMFIFKFGVVVMDGDMSIERTFQSLLPRYTDSPPSRKKIALVGIGWVRDDLEDIKLIVVVFDWGLVQSGTVDAIIMFEYLIVNVFGKSAVLVYGHFSFEFECFDLLLLLCLCVLFFVFRILGLVLFLFWLVRLCFFGLLLLDISNCFRPFSITFGSGLFFAYFFSWVLFVFIFAFAGLPIIVLCMRLRISR